MGVFLYAAVFLCLVVMPLLSFLRTNATFRGGANAENFFFGLSTTEGQRRARRRRYKENVLRIICFFVIMAPGKYIVMRQLDQRVHARSVPAVPVPTPYSQYERNIEAIASAVVGKLSSCQHHQDASSSASVEDSRLRCVALGPVEEPSALMFLWTLLRRVSDVVFFLPRLAWRLLRLADRCLTFVLMWVPFLPSGRTFLFLSFGIDAWYIGWQFLNHHEADPQLRRHNTSRANRLINWAKYNIARRIIWKLFHPLKRYLSVEVVPAYGPLPMFLFPTEENAKILRIAALRERRAQHTADVDYNRKEQASSDLSAASSSSDDNDDWDADELHQVQTRVPRCQERQAHHPSEDSHNAGEPVTEDTPTSPLIRERTRAFTAFPAHAAPASPTRLRSHTDRRPEPLRKEDSHSGNSSLRAPPAATATAAPTPAHSPALSRWQDDSGTSAFTTASVAESPVKSSTAVLPQETSAAWNGRPRPALECAQYFFAAHPHGILPACSLISLLSNFTPRNECLFIDNRGFPSAQETQEALAQAREDGAHLPLGGSTGPSQSVPTVPISLFGEDRVSPTGTMELPRVTALSPNSSLSHLNSATADQGTRPVAWTDSPQAPAFTVTHTRHMSMSSPALSPTSATLTAPTTLTKEDPPYPARSPKAEAATEATLEMRDEQPATASLPRSSEERRYAYLDDYQHYIQNIKHTNPDAEAAVRSKVPPRHAKARYFVYHKDLKCFLPQSSRDEAVPPAGFTQNTSPSPPINYFGTRIRAVVATFPFFVPIMRESYMLSGLLDATYGTCKRVLAYNNNTFKALINRYRFRAPANGEAEETHAERAAPQDLDDAASFNASDTEEDLDNATEEGEDDGKESCGRRPCPREVNMNHLLVFPGGASEALLANSRGPTRLLLRRRRGFLRLALQMRSGLIPVFTFGETDYYDQFSTTSSRFAAPLEDDADSLYDSQRSAAGPTRPGASPPSGDSDRQRLSFPYVSSHTSMDPHYQYYAQAIPSSADDEASIFSPSASPSTSHAPGSFPASVGVGHSPTSVSLSPEQELLLADRAKRRRAYEAQRKAPSTRDKDEHHQSEFFLSSHAGAEEEGRQTRGTARPDTAAAPRRKPARLPRWLQQLQVVVQQTFGISLPFVKNLFPKPGVKGMTVVGRPLFFEIPQELRDMYDNPAAKYDKELERPVLAAAQEVYIAELTDLFYKYAPMYYKDHSRRKLIII